MRLLRSIFFLLLICNKLSASVLVLQEKAQYNPARSISYLSDADGNLTLKDILSNEYKSRFKPITKDKINFAFTQHIYWFRLQVQNPDWKQSPKWLVSVTQPTLDNIWFYIPDENHSEPLPPEEAYLQLKKMVEQAAAKRDDEG